MDKNSFLGFGLLMLLLVGYIVYNQQGQPAKLAAEKKISDSIAAIQKNKIASITSNDSLAKATPNASLDSTAVSIPAQEYVLENDDIAITFSNKGAIPTKVWLKKYKTFTQQPLILFEGEKNTIDVVFQQANGGKINSMNTSFNAKLDAENKKLNFYTTETNSPISFSYKLPKSGYLLEMNITTPNLDKSQNVTLNWTGQSLHTEQDIENEQMNSQVCYMLEKEGYDYYTIRDEKEMKLDEAVKWVSFKRHFFNSTLMTKEKFIISGKINSFPNHDSSGAHISDFSSTFLLSPKETYAFNYYLGPNDYDVLKSAGTGLEEIIPLSYAWLGFVKYINKWLIIPIFNFLSSIFSNYGIVILLLTFIIRLLMSPFTYKSYVSGAKMKALKPELDELKEKYKDNQQEFGVEQMKLYRQAGVNPLGGCLPALLQLPVFFALFSFFPNAIDLRQNGFLWAKDLTTYDSIYNLPFTIPMYGNHISLFTILFVITSLLLALYSMNMAATDQSNPVMKYMPFIMPVMFLGIFNKMPASLTFYYFVSNVITLGIQFVIQNYIINPDKIHAQIQAKKNEKPKESKFMAKMQEMQKQNQERLNKKK